MLADGQSQVEIARELNVSRQAVCIQISGIRKKPGAILENNVTFQLA
jgi:DNA-binding CsgD family transcriptional regulator